MNELLKGDCQNTKYIKNIFAAINSEDAAYSLSLVISHESRQVRMNILKILAEMGKPALRICAGILSDDVYFAPESGRREIPDDKWYIVRNAIFVLGSLEDPEGCHALRKRISVDDIRVKLAIVAALEKIKDESAADLLIVLADDNDREVREAAIIAVGLNAQADIVPELINLAEKRNTEIISIISTLGKLGGVKAREFLSMLLVDNNLLSKYTSNRSSRDDIKLAIIKALGRIGDSESMETVKNFSSSLSSTQKIFFGGSKISRIAEDILKRNRSLP